MVEDCAQVVVIHHDTVTLPKMANVSHLALDEVTFFSNVIGDLGPDARVQVLLNNGECHSHILNTPSEQELQRVDALTAVRNVHREDLELFASSPIRHIRTGISTPIPFQVIRECIDHPNKFQRLESLSWVRWRGRSVRRFKQDILDFSSVLNATFTELRILWESKGELTETNGDFKACWVHKFHLLDILLVVRNTTHARALDVTERVTHLMTKCAQHVKVDLLAYHPPP